jgi:3-methyladenine DNA glycosylase AlkD
LKPKKVLKRLRSLANPKAVAGMARFGINPDGTYGVSIPVLRRMAREFGRDHQLAEELWRSKVHEARILASMIDDPALVTGNQMERWAMDFDSWDVCDQCCSNLFDKTKLAYQKAIEWSSRKEEFVKRAGFALIAALAVHDKKTPDATFQRFLAIIDKECIDERNFVKKAVNWALRQVGKRNLGLNRSAIRAARRMQKRESKSARWIAADALRELTSANVQRRLKRNR